MTLIKWSPFFEPFEEFEKALRDWQVPTEKTFVPALDIYKEKDNLIVKASISDFDPEKVDIEIKDNILTIKGKTEKKSEVEEKNYFRKEIKCGTFSRSVLLPVEVEDNKAKADYKEGVLKITVPMSKPAKAKSVKVKINKK